MKKNKNMSMDPKPKPNLNPNPKDKYTLKNIQNKNIFKNNHRINLKKI